jgi:hypothetical protein
MGSNASQHLKKVLHSNRGRSINLQSFVQKRSAVHAIETSKNYITLSYILIVETTRKSKHLL